MSINQMIEFLCFIGTAAVWFACLLTDESPCDSKHYWWYLVVLVFIVLSNTAYVVLGGA